MAQPVKINYHDWPNCYRLSNDEIELVITTDVGPRIIRFAFNGEVNEFYEDSDAAGQIGSDTWQIYGGHRLWHAPELDGITNAPDNQPVKIEQHDGFVRTIQPPALETYHVQKEMDIRLAEDAHVHIVHRLRNAGDSPLRLAPWSLSVMAAGGRAIVPLPPRGTHPEDLLPTGLLVLWAYVDMSDPRWTWGRQYILLQQQADGSPQKIGSASAEGWAAYVNRGHLFVKTHDYVPGAEYPDNGSSVEIFTNPAMLELETLGPMVTLEPGTTVEHVENWFLFRDVPEPLRDEGVNELVLPKARQALSSKY